MDYIQPHLYENAVSHAHKTQITRVLVLHPKMFGNPVFSLPVSLGDAMFIGSDLKTDK